MAKRHLTQYDSNGNRQEIYLNDDEVIVEGGQTLQEKLSDMEDDIEAAASQGGITTETDPTVPAWAKTPNKPTYTPQEVGAVPAEGFVPTENNYTTEEKTKLAGLPTGEQLTQQIAAAGSGAVSVTTNQDGTFTIHVGETDYTINLNHTHENMAKIVKCTEATRPQTLANDTIYVQVDDLTTPSEIESLWLFGLEFTGGGGETDDGLPKMAIPNDDSTINMGTYEGSAMTKVITVRAKHLDYGGSTTGLTVEADGTGLSLTYGQTTGTIVSIPQTDAMIGVQLTINYSGTGALADGELLFKQGSSVLASVSVVVAEREMPSELVKDTAWNAPSGENFSAPETQVGYCTTPFYQLTHDANGNLDYIVKAGYVTPTDLSRGMFVTKTNLTDALTQSAFLQSTDPKRRQGVDTALRGNYVSATFKMSEWMNCYIYDVIAGVYLFAGLNVDTSNPPSIINQ